jgi:7-cyano-7-deazaguanine synthase
MNKVILAGTRPATDIRIETPLIHLSKRGIVKRGAELNAPFHLTWSCYRESQAACGVCDSCALRLRAFREAGLEDPIVYAYAQI